MYPETIHARVMRNWLVQFSADKRFINNGLFI